MSRHSAEPRRSGIVHLTAHPSLLAGRRAAPLFSGGHARSDLRAQAFQRTIGGVFHAERREDILRRELIDRLAADALHNFGQYDVVHVGVDEPGPGFAERSEMPYLLHRFFRTLLVILELVVGD